MVAMQHLGATAPPTLPRGGQQQQQLQQPPRSAQRPSSSSCSTAGARRRSAGTCAASKRVGGGYSSSAGGGGSGRRRSASRDKSTAVRQLSDVMYDSRQSQQQQREGGGSNGGSAGFGSERRGGRSGRSGRSGGGGRSLDAGGEAEGEVDWDVDDAALLATLSDSEVADLIGEGDGSGEVGAATATLEETLATFDPAVVAAVAAVVGQFSFRLDAFQVTAVAHLLAGKSVVVCAPTGAGKTAIAEAAAQHYLSRGQRVIYTTPLKALSNQKLGEMRERFGFDSAGLQTGDASLNIEAPVVVMTTEILRNMLYRMGGDDRDRDGISGEEGAEQGQGQGGRASSAQDRLRDVGLVVLDEVHYLGDPGRGSVWEEVIINLPPHIQLLSMSATVRNPEDLGGWISQVHGECETVRTSLRPVPLTFQYIHAVPPAAQGAQPSARLLPLLGEGGRSINPALLPPNKRYGADGEGSDENWGRWDGVRKGKISLRAVEELVGSVAEDEWHGLPRWRRIPSLDAAALELSQRGMLPAIWFIFSRKECDLAAKQLEIHGVTLTTPEERQLIQAEVSALEAEQPESVKGGGAVEALLRGVAAHHAGCLPAWKALLERLFQRGLLKLVFATETLAAGINMPARTTLIAALSRRRDGAIGPLQHNELLQMAGRAGRRGYDTQGHCVIVQSKWEDADAAWDILRRGPEPLRSQFSTGYGMVLNLLNTRSLEEARGFLDRSFSAYLGGIGKQRRLAEAERLEAAAQAAMDSVAQRAGLNSASEALWTQYQKLLGRLKQEKQAAKLLRQQLAEERALAAEVALARLSFPRLVGLDLSASNLGDSDYRLPALLLCDLERPGAGGAGAPGAGVWVVEAGPDYLCLGGDNKLYQVAARHISAVAEGPHPIADDPETAAAVMRHARSLRSKNWHELAGDVGCAEGNVVTALVAAKLLLPAKLQPIIPSLEGLAALDEQRQRVRAVKATVNEIKADRTFLKASKAFTQQANKAAVQLERAGRLRAEATGQSDGSWRRFEELLAVLRDAGALEEQPIAVEDTMVDAAGLEGDAVAVAAVEEAMELAVVAGVPAVEQLALAAVDAAAVGDDSGGQDGRDITAGVGSGGTRLVFTPLGRVAREINCANELWMALVLTHSAIQALPAPQLAAVLSAVVSAESLSRPNVWTAYAATPAVEAAVLALEGARGQLSALQVRRGVDAAIGVDLRLSGLVEAWASGVSWEQLMADCAGLDDGDVARLLTRTMDMLRQVAFCDTLLPSLRRAARQGVHAMDRKPINDLVA